MPITGDSLRYNPEKGDDVDLDSILRDATSRELKHVDIYLPQNLILNMNPSYRLDDREPDMKLTPHVLESFLVAQQGLVSFSFSVDDCCWQQAAEMTGDGGAFLPLTRLKNLQKIVISNFWFQSISDLTVILRARTNLKELRLWNSGPGAEACLASSSLRQAYFLHRYVITTREAGNHRHVFHGR